MLKTNMQFIYNIAIQLLGVVMRIGAIANAKMHDGISGRKTQNITKPNTTKKVLWMHCASVGEFEQGLPILQQLQTDYYMVVTFFSPSGYKACANNKCIDDAYYLPLDTQANVLHFIHTINPSLAIFVKYELWFNYLHTLKAQAIPSYLISAFFTTDAKYFSSVAKGFYKKMFNCFTHIFVQDQSSKVVLAKHGIHHSTIVGDTRLDRVVALAKQPFVDSRIDQFTGSKKIMVAGSVWLQDCMQLRKFVTHYGDSWQLIIVPHEIDEANIKAIKKIFENSVMYDNALKSEASVLIVNKMGMLSKLYRFATLCYIGGGFGKGIHNTLEAAVYKKPILFGPNYSRFNEAVFFVNNNIASVVNAETQWQTLITELLSNQLLIEQKANVYLSENAGATQKIIDSIKSL